MFALEEHLRPNVDFRKSPKKATIVPDAVTICTTKFSSSPIWVPLVKQDPGFVYIKLYGARARRSQRTAVMDALDNYFRIFGKIRSIRRLKEKYSYLGDFFVIFEDDEDAVRCSKHHEHIERQPLNPSPRLEIDSYLMKVW